MVIDSEDLSTLARARKWDDLESGWLAAIERPDARPDKLLPIIDVVVEAGESKLAETLGWAWLSTIKDKFSAREALTLGRGLLLRLPDGEQLRGEILDLYQQTHLEHPRLQAWVDHSGIKTGKSVRRALRYLDVGLKLAEGTHLVHRTNDEAVEIVEINLESEQVTLRTSRRKTTQALSQVIEDYDPAQENDFRVLQQLHPARIPDLARDDPIGLVVGILRCHQHRIDRDELKLLLVPKFVKQEEWSDWWGRIRTGVKKSPNLRIEGRSPMYLVYDPIGQSLEQETSAAFSEVKTPRQWLDTLEGYLRDIRHRGQDPDPEFLNRIQSALVNHVQRFRRHREPAQAFATALVIERLAADGLPIATDAHGTALAMLRSADDPAGVVAALPDARLWSLAAECVEQALPDRWPELFADLLLYAPVNMCDVLAEKIEAAGQIERIQQAADQALADPGRFTDATMWLWKKPGIKTDLRLPPAIEMLGTILMLVGPARHSDGKIADQTVGEMRAKIRAGLGARDGERFRECLSSLDLPMAQALRRQIERAEGLGPSVQSDLLEILRQRFPNLYVKPTVAPWEDESVLYFSRAGLRVKEEELHELVNVKMRENAKAIGEAASRGDLSENSEYKFALEERDLLRARVAQLNRELSLAKILNPEDVPIDQVGIGQRISLLQVGTGEPLSLSIMGVGDSDVNRKVFAYQTPIARQLLGKRQGQTARLAFDGGPETEYRIERIERCVE